MNNDLKERLLKLLRMAKQGVGGEKENAEKMLERLLKQHGMTMADIDDEKLQLERVRFPYKSALEQRLIGQIIYSVTGEGESSYYTRGRKKEMGFDLTPPQKAEALVKYSVFKQALKQEMDVFFSAFIMANNIYPTKSKTEETEQEEHTPEEIERIRRAHHMSQGINKSNIFKQIGRQS